MIDNRIKIMMLKGEKGDTYDDTELRAELEARLANTPYTGYTEDGTFQLPIHTIDDSATGTGTTWSSEKINDNITSAIYTYDGTNVTCNLEYSDVVALITNNYFKGALQTNTSGSTYSADDYLIIYDFKYIRGRSSNYLELYAQDIDYKYTITHTSTSITVAKTNSIIADVTALQNNQSNVPDSQTITIAGEKAILTLHHAPCSVTIPASGYVTADIVTFNDIATTEDLSALSIFANLSGYESGGAYVLLQSACLTISNNKWVVQVGLRNLSTSQVSFSGTFDVLTIDTRNA